MEGHVVDLPRDAADRELHRLGHVPAHAADVPAVVAGRGVGVARNQVQIAVEGARDRGARGDPAAAAAAATRRARVAPAVPGL